MMQLLLSGVFYIISICSKIQRIIQLGTTITFTEPFPESNLRDQRLKFGRKMQLFQSCYTCRSCSSPWKTVISKQAYHVHFQPVIFRGKKGDTMCFQLVKITELLLKKGEETTKSINFRMILGKNSPKSSHINQNQKRALNPINIISKEKRSFKSAKLHLKRSSFTTANKWHSKTDPSKGR